MAGAGPLTPAKHTAHAHSDPRLQDSPFSDYFTDDARSTGTAATPGGVAYNAPSSETQQLLVRLNKLQAQLMRSGELEHETLNIVGRKLSEIDNELGALHSQTRLPADMDDSGLFMDEEEDGEADSNTPDTQLHEGLGLLGLNSTTTDTDESSDLTPEHKQAEQDFQLLEAQRILENVTKAQEELRQRHLELVELNDAHVLQIEDREAEAERLRSENEGLRSDLGFDHSELLFLKLQLKAMEVEVDGLEDEDERIREAGAEAKEGIKRVRRGRIADEMDRWREDWHDVDGRFKRRQSKYGVLSADRKDHTLERELDVSGSDEGGEWSLETVKQSDDRGRVSSITIKRLGSASSPPLGLAGAADEDDPKGEPPSPEPAVQQRANQTDYHAATTPGRRTQSTQTDPLPDYASSFASTLRGHSTYDDDDGSHAEIEADEEDEEDDDDCAITTSPTTPGQLSPVLEPQTQPSIKTAWNELWEGLSSLAGVPDYGEEEED